MKILITGAAGQIGSGLSKLLIENGHDLTLVDNLRNGYLENLKDDANEVIAPFYEVDITSGEFFLKCGDHTMSLYILLLLLLYLIVRVIPWRHSVLMFRELQMF